MPMSCHPCTAPSEIAMFGGGLFGGDRGPGWASHMQSFIQKHETDETFVFFHIKGHIGK